MKFTTVLFYILAALAGFAAISCFADGDFGAGVVGLAFVGLFIWLARRQRKNVAKPGTVPPPTPPTPPIFPSSPSSAAIAAAVIRPNAGSNPARWNAQYQYIYENVEIFTPKEIPVDYTPTMLGEAVTLQQAPENPHDNRAVVVLLDGKPIGYLYRGKFQDMSNDFLAAGRAIDVEIEGYNAGEGKIRVKLSFPYKHTPDIITGKLTGNSNNAMQDTISYTQEGETVDVEYDADKKKYLVTCGDDIGYLPSAMAARLSEDEEYEGVVESVDLSDAGKYAVVVSIRL